MKTVLLILLLLHDSLAVPTIEDNKLPTDQELLGQPEEVASLGLPSDEESFNHLSVFFTPSKIGSSLPVGSGTYHFVSSTFPEVDARGFHESVFDGIGDYFPSWPAPYKRGDSSPFTPSLAQRLGLQPRNKFRKRSDTWAESSLVRRKRVIPTSNSSQESNSASGQYGSERSSENKNNRVSTLTKRLSKREVHVGEELEEKENGEKNGMWQNQIKPAEPISEESPYNMQKRSGARYVRGMEMGSSGFHGDVFNGDFGDFTTMKKRLKGSMGFHGDTFSDGFGDFATMKRSLKEKRLMSKLKDYLWKLTEGDDVLSPKRSSEAAPGEVDVYNDELYGFTAMKRKPEMTSMGFHGDTFSGGFGDFYPVKKRKPEMDSMGFHGDTFSRGFGEFEPFKKRILEIDSTGLQGDTFVRGSGVFEPSKKRKLAMDSMGFHGDTFSQGFGDFDTYKKRQPEMDSMGFHGDTFTKGFEEFEPFKKRKLGMDSMGFHGDTFSQGFGDFDTYKKRRPEMDSMGFHGDTFTRGFGEFEPFKKRKLGMGSMGFHGDTFSQGFGDFDTYKKRRPEMDSMGFHGDTFSRGFGDFDTFKKRRPEMDSMGFHGDTFSRGFGDFDTFKKRKPEMDSMGFHGDTFTRGFGDFDVYKKRNAPTVSQGEIFPQDSEGGKTEEKKCCSDSSIQRHPDDH